MTGHSSSTAARGMLPDRDGNSSNMSTHLQCTDTLTLTVTVLIAVMVTVIVIVMVTFTLTVTVL